jgi:DMSO/TMAO reductase YedYZ molybdopterin-dependent catalytic subunit
MRGTRRGFVAALGAAAVALAQSKRGMIVRSVRPEDLEAPLDVFDSWITPVERFFVRSHVAAPTVNGFSWRLRVEGEVATPLTFTLDDLRRFPRHELVAVLECAGNGRAFYEPPVAGLQWGHGAVGNARWAGVRLADVLNKAGLKDNAREILFDGADQPPGTMPKFQRGIPPKKALDENTLLAYEMNGRPLTPAHGFPLRVIAPGWAGDSWVKWVTTIRALPAEFDGFFMSTAYRHPGRPVAPGTPVAPNEMQPVTAMRVKSVIASPPSGVSLAPAPTRIRGAAWSGESPVTAVEVSTDTGRTWKPATLGPDHAPFAWRLWEYRWNPPAEGHYVLMARARDAAGDVQPLAQEWNPSGYLWNVVPSVGVTVSLKPAHNLSVQPRVPTPPPPQARTACGICHEMDVIEQQRLTSAGWERELDKMVRWGAKLKPGDREVLLKWLSQFR